MSRMTDPGSLITIDDTIAALQITRFDWCHHNEVFASLGIALWRLEVAREAATRGGEPAITGPPAGLEFRRNAR